MALLSTDGASDAVAPATQSPSPGLDVRPAVQRSGRRVQIAAAVVAAVLGAVALLGSLRGRTEVTSSAAVHQPAGPAWESEVIEAFTPQESAGSPSDICAHYTKLKLIKCVHNNLALHGPDKGDEGIIYLAEEKDTGHKIELVVNAISAYTPFSPRMNGITGEFGTLNIQSGSSVKVMFHVRDAHTKDPVTKRYFALTFFDLDQGLSETSQESVTVGNFLTFALSDDVNPSEDSEVNVVTNPDGSRTFKSSTFGTGEDNPKHPGKLNKKQRSRAVSVRFENFHNAEVTFAATSGLEPRFFTFVPYPALLCEDYSPAAVRAAARTATHTTRLANLKVGSSETPVVADQSDIFQKWFVHAGDHVMPGSEICQMKRADNSIHIYRAPVKGKVVRAQPLHWGDHISQRMSDKTIAVIAADQILPPLHSETGDAQTVAPAGMIFKKYHVEEKDVVLKGDPIADVTDDQGQVTTLTAAKAGPITARQALTPGDSTDRVQDGNICTIGRFDKLPVSLSSSHVDVPPGSTFMRYLTNVGDHVDMNAPVAEVMVNGNVQEVQTPAAGTVTAREEELLKGMSIDEAMKDHTIIVVGTSSSSKKLPPLPVSSKQHPASVPPGMSFERWHKATGDLVNVGDPLLDVRNPNGQVQTLASTGTGFVLQRQEKLQQGWSVDMHMVDHNLMVIGKLPRLEVEPGEKPALAPAVGSCAFKDWLVSPGDIVDEGTPVAEVTKSGSKVEVVKSPKYGKVKSRQEFLQYGANIHETMEWRDLMVIGRFPAVEASGARQEAVTAPLDAIFEEWYVKKGDKVQQGQRLARVLIPIAGRRLSSHGQSQDIRSPGWGTVVELQPLHPGQKIGEQQEGPNIATLDQGTVWWLGLIFVLAVLSCCLFLMFGVMQKPEPYRPPPVEEPEQPEEPLIKEESEPDGLRLDWQDGNRIIMTYATRRPLGIKHNFVAPIVANDFTVNSYAKLELGVKAGWKLRRIGREELYGNTNFDEVNGKLCDYMKDFDLWPLPISFKRTQNSSEVVTVDFRQRPIGIEFTNRAPIKVSKVYPGSPAAAARIEQGWYVTRIGEADVTQNANFREVIGYFNEGVQPLDEAGTTTVMSSR